MLIVAKLVDDLKITEPGENPKKFFDAFNAKFKLGTINNGPGTLRYSSVNLFQDGDHAIESNARMN